MKDKNTDLIPIYDYDNCFLVIRKDKISDLDRFQEPTQFTLSEMINDLLGRITLDSISNVKNMKEIQSYYSSSNCFLSANVKLLEYNAIQEEITNQITDTSVIYENFEYVFLDFVKSHASVSNSKAWYMNVEINFSISVCYKYIPNFIDSLYSPAKRKNISRPFLFNYQDIILKKYPDYEVLQYSEISKDFIQRHLVTLKQVNFDVLAPDEKMEVNRTILILEQACANDNLILHFKLKT